MQMLRNDLVSVRWYERAWHKVRGWFSAEVRKTTKPERDLLKKIVQLENKIDRLEGSIEDKTEDIRSLENRIGILEAQISVKDVEIRGMAGIITMHEQRWEKEVAKFAREIADATRGLIQ